MKKKGNIFKPLTIVFAVLLAICIIAIPITNQFASVINVALKAQTQKIVAEEGATIYFASSYPDEAELVAHEAELCRQIEGEGAALLVNKDGALPLAKGTKFTTFSQSSYNLLYGGTGSGSMSADDAVTLKSALETVFGEGTVNTEQWKFYVTCGYKRVNAATTGGNQAQYTEFEYSDFEVDEKDDHFVVEVDVKNVGDVDGKHTVQIYFQSPYTEYDKANLVEKAAVEICGFDKKMIRAGHTEHFKIEIKKEDLTSYDANNAKTYILEDGDYYFTIGKNAHDAINNIL
ncbi:MAG: fibronectin type III-like domain-contianing protein, partial [Verrucomicrobia bacterium]|nr:fibronectin type III-like domain-contianing protein [Verrucomicrobiota bacterium]